MGAMTLSAQDYTTAFPSGSINKMIYILLEQSVLTCTLHLYLSWVIYNLIGVSRICYPYTLISGIKDRVESLKERESIHEVKSGSAFCT